ncbi:MAG: APC family permease [Candidatus Heimdallarchaeota archaeon]|nr:APC family permease [Candidatus Heimdallarchaeota archaeon]
MSESKTYVRDATGLVREIGVVTATIFILSNVIGGGWQKRVFQTTGWAPLHPDDMFLPVDPLVIAFLLTGIAALATVFVFAVMATAMPRAGGGYVYISRTISPGVGFLSAWAEFLGIAISYGLIAVAVIDFSFLFLPVAFGEVYFNIGFLLDIFDALNNPFWKLIIGIIFIFAFAAIAYFGTSMTGKFLHAMFWIPAVITIGIYFSLLFGAFNEAAMVSGITHVTGAAPNAWIQDAINSGIDASRAPNYFSAVNTAILGAYWSWIGYAAISFAAGEVKESNKSLPISHLGAGFIILFVYMTVSTLLSMAASVGDVNGWTFFQALGFNNYGATTSDPTLTGFGWMPFVAVMAADGLGFALGGIVPLLFAIAAVLWLANDLPPFVTTSSRILFAMSFDRALPEAFAKVDERWHSPTNAIMFTAIVAVFGAFSESGFFTPGGVLDIPILADLFGNGITATDLFDGIFFTMACVAAIVLPKRLKDVYDRAPWKPKLGSRELVVVIGWVALIANIYLDLIILGEFGILATLDVVLGIDPIPFVPPLVPVIFYGDWGTGLIPDFAAADILATFNWGFWTVVVLILIGLVIYLVMKNYYSKRGVDFTTIYASIPPE